MRLSRSVIYLSRLDKHMGDGIIGVTMCQLERKLRSAGIDGSRRAGRAFRRQRLIGGAPDGNVVCSKFTLQQGSRVSVWRALTLACSADFQSNPVAAPCGGMWAFGIA